MIIDTIPITRQRIKNIKKNFESKNKNVSVFQKKKKYSK